MAAAARLARGAAVAIIALAQARIAICIASRPFAQNAKVLEYANLVME